MKWERDRVKGCFRQRMEIFACKNTIRPLTLDTETCWIPEGWGRAPPSCHAASDPGSRESDFLAGSGAEPRSAFQLVGNGRDSRYGRPAASRTQIRAWAGAEQALPEGVNKDLGIDLF